MKSIRDVNCDTMFRTMRIVMAVVFFSIICALVLSAVSDDSEAKLGDRFTIGEITYEITAEGVTNEVIVYKADESITKYIGDSAVTYNGITYNVTSIGESAFCECKSLVLANIPKGIRTIDSHAFFFCDALSELVIPEGVTSIGDYAFDKCKSLVSVTIPEGVTSIGSSAFNECYGLTTLVIPNTVTYMGIMAFSSCNMLKTLVIPISLNAVVNNTYSAFSCCHLEMVIFTPGTGEGFNYGDTFRDINFHCRTPWNKSDCLTTAIFMDGIKSIGDNALLDCYCLPYVILPSSVTSIGDSAFNSDTLVIRPVSLDHGDVGCSAVSSDSSIFRRMLCCKA